MSQQGFLVIADITGYTRFLTGSELEHAQGVLEDLFAVILERLKSPLILSNIQGDAFFAHADDGEWRPGQLLDAVEALYFGFRDRVTSIVANTSCRCRACANVGDLDLKFIVHHGAFVVQEVAGRHELAGPDVILLHRLLKNDVAERTGIASYALLTAAAVAALGLREVAEGERYATEVDEFGRVDGTVLDLGARWRRHHTDNEVVVAADDPWIELTHRVGGGVEAVWEAWFNPELRMRWNAGLDGITRLEGDPKRLRAGALDHCAHGKEKLVLRYVDVRPFRLATIDAALPMNGTGRYSVLFAPDGDGTRVTLRFAPATGPNPVATWLLRRISDLAVKRKLRARLASELAMLDRFLTESAAPAAGASGLPLSVDQIKQAARRLAAG